MVAADNAYARVERGVVVTADLTALLAALDADPRVTVTTSWQDAEPYGEES